MRTIANVIVILMFGSVTLTGQSSGAQAPQTARQALIEMFFGKTPGTFTKHLPPAMIAALENSGAMTKLQFYSLQYELFAKQVQTNQNAFESFDSGPVMVSANFPQNDTRLEVVVENDALRGDEDEIEVSFRTYKNKQLQRSPFLPGVTFAMKMESGVWTLNDIIVTVHLPLSDPDFIAALTQGLNAAAANGNLAAQNHTSVNAWGANAPGNDSAVQAAMRTILTAEVTYMSAYPTIGYTCTLSDLDGFGGGQPNEHQAMLIPSGLAGGRRYGYTFVLSECTGTPASSFHLTAVPAGLGRRAFCADQSGTIRFSANGNPASCLASGSPVQ
jgi:hypothetical protein